MKRDPGIFMKVARYMYMNKIVYFGAYTYMYCMSNEINSRQSSSMNRLPLSSYSSKGHFTPTFHSITQNEETDSFDAY